MPQLYKKLVEDMQAQDPVLVRLDQIGIPDDVVSEEYLRLGLGIGMASYDETAPEAIKDHILDGVVSHWLRIREEQLRQSGKISKANRLDDLFMDVVEILYPMTGAHVEGTAGVPTSNDCEEHPQPSRQATKSGEEVTP